MKTITHFKWVHRRTISLLMYVFIFMFSGLMHAQTLKTDNDVPALSACGDYEEFTLRIGYGVNPCPNASLEIVMPDHILYEVGSAKLGGVPLTESGATEAGATVTFPIPAGTISEELVITFNAKATCEAIATANLPIDQRPAVTYNLSGCGAATLTGDSEAINIRFAVLNLTINPLATQGVVGDSFTRTVTLQNSGNGYINEFIIVSDPGDDLAVTSTMPATVDGWTVTETTPGTYVFSGSTLAPGATVSFDETVEMTSCGSINTIYEAYYGCTDRCTISNVDDTKTAVITVDNSRRPVLQRSVERVDGNYRCFDEDYTVVWKITNTGTATATGIQLRFGAHYYSNDDGYGSTHVVLGAGYEMADDPDFTTNVTTLGLGAAQLIGPVYGNRFGTTGLPAYQNFTFPNDIAPGQTVYIRYTQRNNSPVVSCEDQTYRILYGSIVGHSGESFYKNADACDPDANIYNVGGTVEYRRNGNTTLNGSNVGSLEASDGTPFSGKFRITNFFAENTGNQFFAPGDYIDIVLEVSPSLAAGLSNAVLSGGTSSNPLPVAVPDGPGKVRFRFEFGTPTWPIGNLSQSLMFLDFNSIMVCPGPSWYKVSYEVNRLACGDSYVQKCHTYNITTFCGPCEEGGLSNSTATVTRLTYGAVAQNPDNQGKPQFPLVTVDPETSAVPIQTTFFMAGDVVEISQVGISKVTGLSPVTEWTAGHFGFTVPNNNLDAGVVPNSGKMVITRGADTYTITGLPVSMSGLVAGMDFDMALLHANGLPATFTGFQDSDQLVSSIQIIANSAWTSTEAAINFATTYHFIHNSSNYACAPGWRATGIMGRLTLDLYRGGGDVQRNLTNCGQQPLWARFDVAINGSVNRNVLFTNEYRQFIFPKKLIMTVPAGLSVDRVYAFIYEQGYSTVPRADIDITPVSGGTVEIELGDHLAAALAESMATIDEGIRIDFNPRTSPTCEATDQVETITMRVEYEAVIPHRQSAGGILLETAGTYQTREAELNYLPDNSKIAAQLINPTVPSTDGTASWVVAVVNSSSFRTFANTWLGGADIVSVQQVTSQAGTTTTGSPLTAIDGVYQIGNLPTMTTRYYRVTANVTGCDDGSVDIAFGHSCDGYPTSVADAACVTHTMEANYTQVVANLQSQIVSQNSASARPLLCEALPYTVMISNSGEGTAFDLLVSIPLTAAEGLAYVPGTLEITPAYSGATVPAFVAAADTNVTVTGGVAPAIIITVPSDIAESLAFGERLQVKFELTSDGCEFRSGQRIGFYPGGINACGTRVANTAGVATNRVIIDGAPEEEPTLTVQTETAEVNITRAVGDPLTAVYNFEFENTGDGVNNFVVDETYGFNVKLPQGWEFVEDPQTLVDDTLLNFVGLDPVKGYVYEFISDLTVGNAIAITDAEMIYTGDVALLDCEDDLGSIVASVYSVFTPNRDPSCGADPACNIEQVVLTSEVPMALPVLPTPTGEEEQEFCETQGATIADLDINIDPSEYIIKWYDAETGGNELTDASPLATGTYYVYVALVDGATGCESDRLEVEVTISEDVTADAGADQELVNETSFTMGGNQPTAPATGEWTFVSGIDADGAALTATDVAIADATAYNTTVEIPLGAEVVMKWTVTNGSCEAEDEVTITSALNTINAEDDDFSSIEINNEDGNANVGNVLPDNGNGADTLGSDDATIANVTITVVTPATPIETGANVPEIDPATGIVSVPANTPSGTYEIEYRICETAILPVENCDTAIVTVVVVDACSLEITCPAAVTVECGDSLDAADLGMPTIISSCGNTTVTYTDSALTGGCSSTTGTFTRTFTVTDENGNEETCTQEITVEDTVVPVFVEELPLDATVECDAVPTAEILTATDNCSDVDVVYTETRTDGACENTYTLTRVWTATDECDNEVSHTQVITVEDTTAPVFVEALPTDVTVECDAVPTAEILTATDNCSDVDVIYTETRTDGACENTYTLTRVWTATDECDNEVSHTQVITVEDNTAPAFNEELPASVTVECNAVPTAVVLTATDNCDAEVTVDFDEVRTDGSCANNYTLTRVWTVTDECGNTNTHTQVVTVQDTTAPAFDQPILPASITVECDAIPEAVELTATDNCDASVEVIFAENITNQLCTNSYTLTRVWTVTDECGNTNAHTQVITVVDTKGPIFTTNPQHAFTECGTEDAMSDYQAWLASYGGAVAEDACGEVTMSYWIEDTNTICGNAGTVIVNFVATDECGNRTIRQAGFAFRDTTPPVITTEATDLVIECSINGEDELNAWLSANGEAVATDLCGQVTWSHNYQGQLAICGAPITVTFTATDACGNFETTQATVQVVDTIVPVLTKQAQSLTVQCGANTDQALNNWLVNHGGAEAIDNCATVTWTNDYDPANFAAACGNTGSVEVTFTGSDSCGNTVTTTATFTIEDTAAPILVTPAQPQTAECGADAEATLLAWLANNGGATATDSCDADLTWTNDYNDGANFIAACGNTGEVTVTFTATDDCGNSVSTVAKFTIVDTTKPVFDINPQSVEAECDGAGNEAEYEAWLAAYAGAQASDNCGEVTYSYSLVDTAVLCGKTFSRTVRFTATDECGNRVSQQATFTIVDTTAPEFITEPEDVTVECDGAGNINDLNAWLNSYGGATAEDICSTEVKWSNNFRGLTTTCGGAGTAEVTFTATDACGNSSSRTATFTIVDTTAPEFVSELPSSEIFIRCEDLQPAETLKAADNCSDVTVVSYDEIVASDCGDTKYQILRTWVATDDCGNETTFTQTIHMSCQIEVFNAVTPNGDGYNDELELKGIECYPGNTVEIFNRWGVMVWSTQDYNSNGNTFNGYSNGRATISQDGMLPSGTYYYIIRYDYDLGNGSVYPIEQAGYLHLETNK